MKKKHVLWGSLWALSVFGFILLSCGKVAEAPQSQKSAPRLRSLWEGSQRNSQGIRFIPVPLVRQSRNFTCGLGALQSILFYWGDELREAQLHAFLKSNPVDGTGYKQIRDFVLELNDPKKRRDYFNALGKDEEPDEGVPSLDLTLPDMEREGLYSVEIFVNKDYFDPTGKPIPAGCKGVLPPAGEPLLKTGLNMESLQKLVDQRFPVLVLIQGWANRSLEDYVETWDTGHYVVVMGYDAQNIYVMDPAMIGNYGFIPKSEFMARWHEYDGPLSKGALCPGGYYLRNFGMVIRKNRPPPFDLDLIPKAE